jgi:hypothetical protein
VSHAPGIVVGRGRRGRGVFAARRFREGEVVEACPAVLIPDEEVADGVLRGYVFASRRRGKVLLLLGYGMLYNHSPQPNLYHRTAGRLTIEFVALRDIAAGEELTHDYGPNYWNDRGRRPR